MGLTDQLLPESTLKVDGEVPRVPVSITPLLTYVRTGAEYPMPPPWTE